MRSVGIIVGVLIAIAFEARQAQASDDLCGKILPGLNRSLIEAQAREDWEAILRHTTSLTEKLDEARRCPPVSNQYAAHAAEAICDNAGATRAYDAFLAHSRRDAARQDAVRTARENVQQWIPTELEVSVPPDAANKQFEVRVTCVWSSGASDEEKKKKRACIASTAALELKVARPEGASCKFTASVDGVVKKTGELEPTPHMQVAIEDPPVTIEPKVVTAVSVPEAQPPPVKVTPASDSAQPGGGKKDPNIFSDWVFWTIGGAVVVGIIATTIALAASSDTEAPVPATTKYTPPGASLQALRR